MTPAEFYIYADGYLQRRDEERETGLRNIYNLACAVRVAVGAKHMPQFEQMFIKTKTAMTDQAMFKAAEALCMAYGGKMEDV